jgi:protein YIPF5/7
MAQYYQPQYGQSASPAAAENLQFFHGGYSQPAPSQPGQPSYGISGNMGTTMGGGGVGSFRDGPGLRTGWLAAFSTEGYENEPTLLEELGIDFRHVQAKTLAVLNPFSRVDSLENIMQDSDLAGPLLFVLLFGMFLLASGKVHFGYIYGLAVMGSTMLHTILGLMTPDTPPQGYAGPEQATSTLTFTRSASVLGYCLLPLVITSLLGVIVPLDSTPGYILTLLAICWSTLSSSAMFCGTCPATPDPPPSANANAGNSCRKDEEHARPRRLPARSFLRRLRHHLRLQQPRERLPRTGDRHVIIGTVYKTSKQGLGHMHGTAGESWRLEAVTRSSRGKHASGYYIVRFCDSGDQKQIDFFPSTDRSPNIVHARGIVLVIGYNDS